MHIKAAHIKNFRALAEVEIAFDDVTTLLGPNGSGKSSILYALDWFFNGGTLTKDDITGGQAEDAEISVQVEFDRLTNRDREALGARYADPTSTTFSAWRTWRLGNEKMTGKALAFEPFEKVREASGVAAKKEALLEAASQHPDLGIPRWSSSIAATEAALSEWERAHPEALKPAWVSDTHFFGFNGQAKLSGLFDFALVRADLRASEEAADTKSTLIGRILARAIDRTEVTKELGLLLEAFSREERELQDKHLRPQLDSLAEALTREVASLTPDKLIHLRAAPTEIKPAPAHVEVKVADSLAETDVSRQGHGFQRTVLIAALKLLADRGPGDAERGTLCLAVEEPELYQHPTQARAFATVLRALADGQTNKVQVMYATHSPYFIEPRFFDQVRRVTRIADGTGSAVEIRQASLDKVSARLAGFEQDRAIRGRWEQVCLQGLGEAVFANGVLLVEGDNDRAILEGLARQGGNLALAGIAVAASQGKAKILLPVAILEQLGIPVLTIVDNDAGCEERARRKSSDPLDIESAVLSTTLMNRKILRYFGEAEHDFPKGLVNKRLMFVDDRLEKMLERDWPAWEETRERLVEQGQGVEGKNSSTYALAASECATPPEGDLRLLLEAVWSLSA